MISIIAAIGKNRELGKNNKLLWHIKEDMIRFKNLTTNQVVIMGRKTYESLPYKFKPLPNRINIVVTRKSNESHEIYWVNSIEDAIEKAKEFNKEIFIIGGAQIYNLGIKYCDKLYLTLVDKEYLDADVFFPGYSDFKKVVSEENYSSENLQFKFIELVK
ncbi:dihydrofolate reductase [Candidatus Roizmanbacteria bacterium]|nr:dihydrofolate reductase [Candidatus Roizmanbacteria bacterium]